MAQRGLPEPTGAPSVRRKPVVAQERSEADETAPPMPFHPVGLSRQQVQVWQRMAGNRAVASALGPVRSAPPGARDASPAGGLAVQRWAWVSAAQVKPDEAGLDPAMKAFAADKVVRDYGSDA